MPPGRAIKSNSSFLTSFNKQSGTITVFRLAVTGDEDILANLTSIYKKG